MAALVLVVLITMALCHLLLEPLSQWAGWWLEARWWPWLLVPTGLWLVAGRPAKP